MIAPLILRSLQFLLGAVFAYAGASKIGEPLRFADSIASFQILPMLFINPLALTLPPLEILTGLMLLATVRREACGVRRVSALSAMVMSAVFTLALGSALARGIQVDCGCFTLSPPSPRWLIPQQGDLTAMGAGKPSILKTWLALGRDLLFLAVAAAIYRMELQKLEMHPSVAADSRS